MTITYNALLTLFNIFVFFNEDEPRDVHIFPSPPPLQVTVHTKPIRTKNFPEKCVRFRSITPDEDMKNSIVSIHQTYTRETICLGVLVHEIVVLVPSECVEHFHPSEIYIKTSTNATRIKKTEISIPSHIAVLYLTDPVNVTTVKLPKKARFGKNVDKNITGCDVTLLTKVNNTLTTSKNLIMISHTECKKLNKHRYVSIFKFCTIEPDKNCKYFFFFWVIMS